MREPTIYVFQSPMLTTCYLCLSYDVNFKEVVMSSVYHSTKTLGSDDQCFVLLVNIHSKQLRSCQDGQLSQAHFFMAGLT